MKSLSQWMHDYAQSHTHPTNQLIHKICVPLITFSLLGMLWSIPSPAPWPVLNWASLFYLACLFFYLRISLVMTAVMLLQGMAMLGLCHAIAQHSNTLLLFSSLAIFVVAWIFQFIGHKIEGKRPSFFKDLQFLLIGPLWVLMPLVRKTGIRLS